MSNAFLNANFACLSPTMVLSKMLSLYLQLLLTWVEKAEEMPRLKVICWTCGMSSGVRRNVPPGKFEYLAPRKGDSLRFQ